MGNLDHDVFAASYLKHFLLQYVPSDNIGLDKHGLGVSFCCCQYFREEW